MDMTYNEFEYLTNICWDEKNQALTTDETRAKFTGCYRQGLKSIFVPDKSLFQIK